MVMSDSFLGLPALSPVARLDARTDPAATLLGGRARRGHLRSDPDRLDVRELADPERAELASPAAPLHTPEGQARVGRDPPVDEDRAGLDRPGQRLSARNVAGASPPLAR
jgi:hypothetical protein